MAMSIQLPNMGKKNIVFLLIAFAIALNMAFTFLIVFLQKNEFTEQSILTQSQTALGFLSRDTSEGNYRKVIERLSGEEWANGIATKSVLIYDLISKEIITSNTETDQLICKIDTLSSYIITVGNDYISCVFMRSGPLIQIVFVASPFAFLTTPQFLTVLFFNLIFAGILILLSSLGMSFYLDKFILLLKKLVDEGSIGKNVPEEFKPSFKYIEKLSQSLEDLKNKVSKNTEDITINKIYKKVIHNIRNPLNTINVTLPLCRNGFDDKKEGIIREALKEIEVSITKALEGYRSQKSVPVNLYEIIEQARNEINLNSTGTIVLPIAAHGKSKNAMRTVDPMDFKAAIINILNNAVEAMPRGGEVTIEMKYVGLSLAVSIADEGSGINEAILPKLGIEGFSFNKYGGNGLGLYTAKRDIQSWGGGLAIGNRSDGKGAVATIIL